LEHRSLHTSSGILSVTSLFGGMAAPQGIFARKAEILRETIERLQQKPWIGEIDRAEVERHNTSKDLWVIFDGYVYDVTEYAAKHPGGPASGT